MAAHPVDEKLPALKMATSGLQHVAAMYAGVVAPPLIIGAAVGLTATDLTFLTGACLFTAGLATLLQTLGVWKIGARLPFVNGVTFAGVAPMTAVVASTRDKSDALPVIFGAVVVAGLLGFLAAPFFSKAVRFFPPVVTGSVITLIGVSLLPVAFGWAQGPDPKAGDYGSVTYLTLAGVTLAIVLLLRRFTRGFVKQIAVLLGLIAGTLLAVPFGVTDFGPVAHADVVGFPTPFHFGTPQFRPAAILSLCVVMVVSMTESTADILALGEIVERPADERTIAAGLRADTLGSALSPLFNGFMCSAFAQNIGLVAMTRIRSRYVVATAGGFLVLMGLCPMAASLIAVVPRPVLGGAGVVLFGSVAASGIQTLVRAGLDRDGNILTVAVSLAVGMIPITAPAFYHSFPETAKIVLDSGISTGCVAAVVLNLLFNHLGKGREAQDATRPVEAGEEIAAAH
ncbi:uracil permease [Streptomyces pluripotens]|uniref:Uracil permease n=1 Tax=Streptomyces pluripotens TaxID=1355015 RepID=A0A221P5F0_9ACTN|nr:MULTISPECIES: nucleobase:cation symporter-2 family protein [Streptomyces]ARP73064.1 uracil permease [Streptomyces pluripotens]ASN27316.1 uracil permease [Streptomyces pluripotens]MCH0557981.1 purine permease [Streptomyces sp. MUM 16J]